MLVDFGCSLCDLGRSGFMCCLLMVDDCTNKGTALGRDHANCLVSHTVDVAFKQINFTVCPVQRR